MRAYVGTFTAWGDQGSEGLYAFDCDAATGALEPLGTAALENPSILAISTRRRVLYAATHTSHFLGLPGAGLVAFALEPGGELRRIGHQIVPSPHPAYVALDRAERFVLVASGLGGAASVFPIEPAGAPGPAVSVLQFDGRPSVPLGRTSTLPMRLAPGAPHPHCVAVAPGNRFALVTDLGHGRVHVLRLGGGGELSPHATIDAAGARHIAFAADGATVFVNDEGGSALHAFAWDAARGTLEHLRTASTVPAGAAAGNTSADLHVHPSGRFVYVSNRGHDSVAVFTAADLEPVGHAAAGLGPRGFGLTPDGSLLLAAGQAGSEIVAFGVDPATGALEPTGARTRVPSPVCVRFG